MESIPNARRPWPRLAVRKWEKFLHVHKLGGNPTAYQRRLEIFARAQLVFRGGGDHTERGAGWQLARAKQLRLLPVPD